MPFMDSLDSRRRLGQLTTQPGSDRNGVEMDPDRARLRGCVETFPSYNVSQTSDTGSNCRYRDFRHVHDTRLKRTAVSTFLRRVRRMIRMGAVLRGLPYRHCQCVPGTDRVQHRRGIVGR
jgi:hypothetical protein